MNHERALGRGWSLAGAMLTVGLLGAPAWAAAPSVARGEQFLPVNQEECLLRAHRAFVGEGWNTFGAEGTWVGAFKGIHSAYITCNVSAHDQVVVNIFVASQAPEGDVPGRERVKLQERMAAMPQAAAPTAIRPAPTTTAPPATAKPASPPPAGATAKPAPPTTTTTPQATKPPLASAPAPMPPAPGTATPRAGTPVVSAPAPLPPAAPSAARPSTPPPPPSGPVASKGTDPTGNQWDEWEGHYQGVWTRRGTSNVWDASWGSVKAVLTLSVQGNRVRVQRRHGSDGNICDYQGLIEPDGITVQGSFNCANGATDIPWRAVIRR